MLDLLCSYKIIPGIPFQISINHYENPSQGMVKHRDGPATQVVIITLGSSAILDFYKLRPANSQTQYQTEVYTEEDVEDDKPVVGLFLRPRSVVRLTQSSYEGSNKRIPNL